jgi:hypothetical protein
MNDSIITLRVTGGARDVARVSVRRQQFVVGRPIEFDAAAPRIAALEYALGAVGAEVVNGLREFSGRRRIQLDAMEAVVMGELEHELVYLDVIGELGRPALRAIHVKVFAECADPDAVRALFNEVVEKLPLSNTLRAATRFSTELIFIA